MANNDVLKKAIWMFPKMVVPPNHPIYRVFHYKPSILGYPYVWKHPYGHWKITKICKRMTIILELPRKLHRYFSARWLQSRGYKREKKIKIDQQN